MISVLLFKIKKWYANALEEYQDSKVSKMQERVYNGRTYTDMQPLPKEFLWLNKAIEDYERKMFKAVDEVQQQFEKREHKKTKGDT